MEVFVSIIILLNMGSRKGEYYLLKYQTNLSLNRYSSYFVKCGIYVIHEFTKSSSIGTQVEVIHFFIGINVFNLVCVQVIIVYVSFYSIYYL
jgi:hypothetical protein